jgi:uncharacterized membrane protein
MSIISTVCATGPMKSKSCFAIFGVEYQTYLWLFFISILIGFVLYSVSQIKDKNIDARKFIFKSLKIVIIVFLILSVITIYLQSGAIY